MGEISNQHGALNELVCRRIRAQLAYRGQTHGELARALGMTQQSTSRRLTGISAWNIDELARVREWLGMTWDELLGD